MAHVSGADLPFEVNGSCPKGQHTMQTCVPIQTQH